MVGLTVSLEMAALGAEERRMCFFFPFLFLNLQSIYSRKLHNGWQLEMFLCGIIKSDAGRCSE